MTSLVFYLIESLGSLSPIVVGLLCLCVVAALQSTISAILMTSGGMVARDLYRPYIDKNPSWKRELLVARLGMLLLSLASLYLATFFETSIILFFTKGPLSLTLRINDLLFSIFVTLTSDGNCKVLCAAVSKFISKTSPFAVFFL